MMKRFLLPLALMAALLLLPTAGLAASTVTPAQAQQALSVLQNAQKRDQLIETLQTIAKAAPASASASASASVSAPAPAPAPTPAPTTGAAIKTLLPNGLGAQLLRQSSAWIGSAAAEIVAASKTLTHSRVLTRSLVQFLSAPGTQVLLVDAAWRLVVVLGCAGLVEWLVWRLVQRSLRWLEAAAGAVEAEEEETPAGKSGHSRLHLLHAHVLAGRLPLIAARLFLDLLPAAVFFGVALLLLGTPIGANDLMRLAILTVVNAYLFTRIALCLTRLLVAPRHPRLRLWRLRDQAARQVERWVRRVVIVLAFGVALAQVAYFLGLSKPGYDALVRLVGLIAAVLLAAAVLCCRRPVAARLRPPDEAKGAGAAMRNLIASAWHYLAIIALAALWIGWAIAIRNGTARVVLLAAETLGVVVGARLLAILALALLGRILPSDAAFAKNDPGLERRTNRYLGLLRALISIVITVVALFGLLQLWGFGAFEWLIDNRIAGRFLNALITIAIAIAVAVVLWETINAVIERHLLRLANSAEVVRSARLRTLLPILRTCLFLTILAVVGLTALSEIGVNIAPLLAGAGIVGIAVGFGSQKLVQDVITGLFLLLENAMQVGDWVTVASLSGSVEYLSIRTLRLRAGDGSVHIIPFSSVTSVTNTNRGIGNAAVRVDVDYGEDTDRVGQLLKDIATEMRQEPDFKAMMLSDLQLWGVDKVEGATVTMAGQIVCTASGRWGVQREFNRRMKKKFEEAGITLGKPAQTILLQSAAEAGEAGEAAPADEPSALAPRRAGQK